MVDRNDALLRELDDEVRAENMRKLWARYRMPILAAVLALPLGAAAWQVYDLQRRSAAEAAGARFEAALKLLSDKKPAEAEKAFGALVSEAPRGYATLARFQAAAALVKADKPVEAVSAFEAIASDSSAQQTLRDMARLQAASLRLEAADWTEMQNRLTLLTDEKNAFRSIARELLGLAALKAGMPADARRAFLLVLGDAKTSPTQKERVQAHLAGITVADAAAVPPVAAAPPKP